jgi:hypothetical protein
MRPKKKAPQKVRPLLKQPVNKPGKAEDSEEHAYGKGNQEEQVDALESLAPFFCQQEAYEGMIKRLERIEQGFVNASHIGYGAAGNAWHDIGSAHGKAAEEIAECFFMHTQCSGIGLAESAAASWIRGSLRGAWTCNFPTLCSPNRGDCPRI